ncbi:hypothetical protein NHQ30_005423 [Ciborinia camelliae]|nr:hypothetical protein NHQ30_005423 [Ciborinia camelliae]
MADPKAIYSSFEDALREFNEAQTLPRQTAVLPNDVFRFPDLVKEVKENLATVKFLNYGLTTSQFNNALIKWYNGGGLRKLQLMIKNLSNPIAIYAPGNQTDISRISEHKERSIMCITKRNRLIEAQYLISILQLEDQNIQEMNQSNNSELGNVGSESVWELNDGWKTQSMFICALEGLQSLVLSMRNLKYKLQGVINLEPYEQKLQSLFKDLTKDPYDLLRLYVRDEDVSMSFKEYEIDEFAKPLTKMLIQIDFLLIEMTTDPSTYKDNITKDLREKKSRMYLQEMENIFQQEFMSVTTTSYSVSILSGSSGGGVFSTETTIVAPSGDKHTHTVIFLHGRDDYGEDLARFPSIAKLRTVAA